MSFNNGNERRKLNAKWEQLRVQYREAGMSEEAIQAMYEFDLGVLNSERAYDASTVAVCDGEDDVAARNRYLPRNQEPPWMDRRNRE